MQRIPLCEPTDKSVIPLVTLNNLSTDASASQELTLKPDCHGYWRNWKRNIQKLLCRTASGANSRSLVITVLVDGVAGKKTLSALVDTGAAVPLVVRKGVLPRSSCRNLCVL